MVAKMSGFRTVTAQLRDRLCYFPFGKETLWFAVPRKVSLKPIF